MQLSGIKYFHTELFSSTLENSLSASFMGIFKKYLN